jgi:hypothetical protein
MTYNSNHGQTKTHPLRRCGAYRGNEDSGYPGEAESQRNHRKPLSRISETQGCEGDRKILDFMARDRNRRQPEPDPNHALQCRCNAWLSALYQTST